VGAAAIRVPAVTGAPDEREPVLDALRRDPRPAVSRAALAARYLSWGLLTLSLLLVGLVVGFASLGPLGATIQGCATAPDRLVCNARAHAVVVALPMASLIAGLAVALVGGRLAVRLGRSPLAVAAGGWALFVAGTVAAFVRGGLR
jgi:hypothetical protein